MPAASWWSQTFVNDGGPLIALPHDLIGHWPGSRADYDRACDARRPFDFFPAGPGLIVVADSTDTMLYSANWVRPAGHRGVVFVGWTLGGPDRQAWLIERLSRPGPSWRRYRRRVDIGSGVLLLQHAAGPAADVRFAPPDRHACIGQTVPVGVEPGRYAMDTFAIDEQDADERYCCVLCRWSFVAPSPAGGRAGRRPA